MTLQKRPSQKILRDFSGGLSRQLDSHLIQDNQGEVYINIDHTKGSLTPIRAPVLTGIELVDMLGEGTNKAPVYIDKYMEWRHFPLIDSKVEVVEYLNKVYYLNQEGKLILGSREFAEPISLNRIDLQPVNLITAQFVNKTEENSSDEDITYEVGDIIELTYTYRSTSLDLETTPHEVQRFTAPEGGKDYIFQLNLGSNISTILSHRPIGFERISFYILIDGTYIRAFEIVGKDHDDSLADALPADDADKSDIERTADARKRRTEIRENSSFLSENNVINWKWFNPGEGTEPSFDSIEGPYEIEGTPLTTIEEAGAPSNIRNLTEVNSRLYASSGNFVYFSDVGQGHAWKPLNVVSVPEPVTALSKVYIRSDNNQNAAGLLIHSKNQTWMLVNVQGDLHRLQLVSGNQGCINATSCQNINGMPIWVSRDGICVYKDGIQLLTKKVSGYWNSVSTHILSSAVYNNSYYVLRSIPENTNETGKLSAYVIDFDYGIHKEEIYDNTGITYITTGNNMFMGYVPHSNICYNLAPLEGPFAEMKFRSKRFNIGVFSANQPFDKITFAGESFVEVQGNRAETTALDIIGTVDNDEALAFSLIPTIQPKQIKMKSTSSRGSYFQIEISGKQVIYDIRWPQEVEGQ